jgi:hypothetical protein
MFRFIIGYTLIFTAFATIAASSPAVAAPQQMRRQIALKRCLLIASRQRISRQKSGMDREGSAAIWTIHVKRCLKGGSK